MLHYIYTKTKCISFILIFCIACCVQTKAQNVDLGNLKNTFRKDKLIHLTGGLNANTIFYDGNAETGRDPFTWFIGGNMNINLFGQINLPFSLNLTNAGAGLQLPTSPNRISLHPTYKWVAAHIGDISMTFSPYTLSGHQFTGLGFDLTPKGKFKISAMYGRMQRAVEYDTLNRTVQATYKRMGYGTKISYENKGYTIGMTMFSAKDMVNSLQLKPDSQQVFPQQNLVTSWNIGLRPVKGIEFFAEYAISALTRDIRDSSTVKSQSNNILHSFIPANNSTSYYKAMKLQVNYNIKKTTMGFGFERIDPGYRTLGTYFFSNDLENLTINFSEILFKNKLMLAMNFGIQRDDLDGAKSGSNNRYIGSLNINYNPNQKMAANFSYSNFQTYMNIKPIFQYINQLNQFQNLDTLNFTQISQNANLNLNYIIQSNNNKSQSLNLNLSFQDAFDMQGGIVRTGGASQFYNGAASYNILFVPKSLSITTAFNISYNTIAADNFITLGPTLAVNSKWLHKKVTTGFTTSYNSSTSSTNNQSNSSVLNIRFNAGYTFMRKHNLLLSIMNQTRTAVGKEKANSLVANMGYSINF